MSTRRVFSAFFGLFVVAAIVLLGLPQQNAHAQFTQPTRGVVAFLGVDALHEPAVYVLDLSSGKVGQIDVPVTLETNLQWSPDGKMLAFTTTDGAYGLLRSLRGCFNTEALCSDVVEVFPPLEVTALRWSPEGDKLYFLTTDGLKVAPPRARASNTISLDTTCKYGFALAGDPLYMLCAAEANGDMVQVSVYEREGENFTRQQEIGTYLALTAFDIALNGNAAIGTTEAGGDSGFFAPVNNTPSRLASYQIHIYDLEFQPNGAQIAIAGATSDATADGTLRDGDPAELFFYDTAQKQLRHIPGFTDARAVTWSPDGQSLLIVTGTRTLSLYTPATDQTEMLNALLPAELTVLQPDWADVETGTPGLPTLAPPATATHMVTATRFPTLTPLPTIPPRPTNTVTPFPTLTPIPSATPGSPMGTGCQYAYPGAPPVAVGDTAEVTPHGVALRFRTAPALTSSMIKELMTGTRMAVLAGPFCSQGYRWWQVQLESDGQIGYVADSNPQGYWIQKVVPTTPTPVTPSVYVNFTASQTTIVQGACVTIQWDAEGIDSLYYGVQGSTLQGVVGHDSRSECPTASTTYALEVHYKDGAVELKTITIFVIAP